MMCCVCLCVCCFIQRTHLFHLFLFWLECLTREQVRRCFYGVLALSICYLKIWIKYYSNIRKKEKECKREKRSKKLLYLSEAAYCFSWLYEGTSLTNVSLFIWRVYYFVVNRFCLHCTRHFFMCVCAIFSSFYLRWTPNADRTTKIYSSLFPFFRRCRFSTRISYLKCSPFGAAQPFYLNLVCMCALQKAECCAWYQFNTKDHTKYLYGNITVILFRRFCLSRTHTLSANQSRLPIVEFVPFIISTKNFSPRVIQLVQFVYIFIFDPPYITAAVHT